jgi:hypothetical protein
MKTKLTPEDAYRTMVGGKRACELFKVTIKSYDKYGVGIRDKSSNERPCELFDWLVDRLHLNVAHNSPIINGFISRQELIKRWGVTSHYLKKLENRGELKRIMGKPIKYKASEIDFFEDRYMELAAKRRCDPCRYYELRLPAPPIPWQEGLSIRLIEVLRREELFDISSVKEAFLTGKLNPKKDGTRGYGSKSKKELEGLLISKGVISKKDIRPPARRPNQWKYNPFTGELIK